MKTFTKGRLFALGLLLLSLPLIAAPNPVIVPGNFGGIPGQDIDLDGTYKVIYDADGDSYSYSSSDDVIDFYEGGDQAFRIFSNGAAIVTGGLRVGTTTQLYWNGRSELSSKANGNITMTNDAGTGFTSLSFGPYNNASFPMLKVNGANLELRLGDDSSRTSLLLSSLVGSGNIEAGEAASFRFTGRSRLYSSADGSIEATKADGSTPSALVAGDVSKKTVKGALTTVTTTSETLTFAANPGDASKTTSGLIPDGAFLVGVSTRVLTAGTNCTSMDLGDGSDVDIFGNDVSIADTSTTDNSDATAAFANPMLAATEVTITGVGGNCFDLSVAVTAHYMSIGAATSD